MADRDMQINVDFANFPELYAALLEMVEEDMTNKSIFMRRLVQQEANRRQQDPTSTLYNRKRKTNPRTPSLSVTA